MKDAFGIVLSLIVVALMVYAVILFITSGASALFYAVVIIDLVISFVNAWLISSGRYERPMEARETERIGATVAASKKNASAGKRKGRKSRK
jgi:hypothetical protein